MSANGQNLAATGSIIPATDRWHWYFPVTLVALLIAAACAGYGYLIRLRSQVGESRRLVPAIMSAQIEVSQAHLWIEEVLAGDQTASRDTVETHLVTAHALLSATLRGGEWSGQTIAPVSDTHARASIERASKTLTRFRKIGKRRLKNIEISAAGSASDAEFDEAYHQFLTELHWARTRLQQTIAQRTQTAKYTEIGIAASLFFLAITIGLVLLWFGRRSARHARELQQAESKQRHTAEELVLLNDNLEIHVTERTEELEQTNQKLAQKSEALHRSEAYSRSIVDHAGDAIFTINSQKLIESWNAAAQITFGFDADEAIGKMVSSLVVETQDGTGQLDKALRQPVGSAGRHLELIGLRKNGSRIPLEAMVTQIPAAAGSAGSAFTAIVRDMSAKKRAAAKLDALNQQLIAASRQAGMAEVATGILHNVGNVLNSVGVSATLCGQRIENMEAQSVVQLGKLIEQHADDLSLFLTEHPKGKRAIEFLNALGERLVQERSGALNEVALLHKSVDHLKVIVSTQQVYAQDAGRHELTELGQVLDDALALTSASFQQSGIALSRSYEAVGPISIDRHAVLQIMINLLQNARASILKHECQSGEVKVTIARHGEGRLRITVSDNGEGIASDLLKRVFEQGYSTKKTGRGVGLSSSVSAAKRMGATLRGYSAGETRGAEFVLELREHP